MKYTALIGRILFSMIFIMSGINHITNFETVRMLAENAGVPVSGAATVITGILIFLGGMMVMTGYYAKIGALLIFLCLMLFAFMVHDFWNLTDPQEQQIQMVNFMKNLALAGASLLIFHFGSGPVSMNEGLDT